MIRRALYATWAIWFSIALAEPAFLHQCAVHDGHAASAPAAAASQHSHAHHQQQQEGKPHCTCLGDCCAGAPVSIRVTPVVTAGFVLVASGPVDQIRSEAVPPVALPAHARPFATAPPA